ncbi:hypothetical protein [Brucella oryzae]|uniref:hypothetical protein n=1 Tax=Brucella oryzae TaxID=335286 RepID=UPI003D15F383
MTRSCRHFDDGHGDIGMAVGSLKKGAFDFIAKPFAADHLISSVRRSLEMRRLVLKIAVFAGRR